MADTKRIYELPDIKKHAPDLANATPEMLVDELGRIRRIASRCKKLEGFYKEALKARWPTEPDPNRPAFMDTDGNEIVPTRPLTTLRGEIYGAEWSEVTQKRMDGDAVREHYDSLGQEVPMKEVSFVSIRSNGSEDLDEFVIDVGDWDNI